MIPNNSMVRIYHPDKSGGFWPEHGCIGNSKLLTEGSYKGSYRVNIIYPAKEKGRNCHCPENALTILNKKEITDLGLVGKEHEISPA